jgi:protein-disulfide isomerase
MTAQNSASAPLSVQDDDHTLGPKDAPVVLIEYADFQCPYCGMAEPVVRRLRERFKNTMLYVFREYPLVESHRYALVAARAAEAAGAQEKFWEMHDLLFEHQRSLDPDHLARYARSIGLDVDRFERDVENGAQDDKIQEDMQSGDDADVPGTPTFFVNGVQYFGPPDFDELAREIQQKGG